jgi:hypothetical protein
MADGTRLEIRNLLRLHVLPAVIAPLYWLLARSWRVRVVGDAEVIRRHIRDREPAVFAHWHGDELLLIGFYRFRRLAVLASLSDDGSLMARTLTLLGYRVFRGSSSRGGARGLLGLIRSVKHGAQAALAVDGPKGPLHVVKPGIVELALRTGQPIVPARAWAKRAWRIPRTWNRAYLPKPFTVVTVEFLAPVATSSDPAESCSSREERISSTTIRVQQALGG